MDFLQELQLPPTIQRHVSVLFYFMWISLLLLTLHLLYLCTLYIAHIIFDPSLNFI